MCCSNVQKLTDYYVNQLLPGRRETGTKAAYEEVLGRAATTDELAKAKEQMALNYATKEDVKDDMSQLMQRFDRLESKIDDMIRRAAEK